MKRAAAFIGASLLGLASAGCSPEEFTQFHNDVGQSIRFSYRALGEASESFTLKLGSDFGVPEKVWQVREVTYSYGLTTCQLDRENILNIAEEVPDTDRVQVKLRPC